MFTLYSAQEFQSGVHYIRRHILELPFEWLIVFIFSLNLYWLIPQYFKFRRIVWLFSQFQVFYSCLVHSKVHFLNGLVTLLVLLVLVFYWPSLNYCLFMLSWWPYQKWESANSKVEKDEFRCIKIWAVPRVMFEYSYTVPSFYCCWLLLAFLFCSYIGLKCCLC